MPRLFRRLSVALALAALATPALPQPGALAQVMQSYLPRRLTTSDMDILRAEAEKLGPHGLSEEAWKNPATGHSGVVTFLKAHEHDGIACRRFKYVFHTGARTDGLPYELTWCRKPAGEWVIAPPKH